MVAVGADGDEEGTVREDAEGVAAIGGKGDGEELTAVAEDVVEEVGV